ncbi:SGNH/GDSL hydrolase family protein [Granulicella arctica]|uniref:SGNH/GDSL hydrolase family protein n=1 Tax=Granulicella arctica TaxID=940613 RepID=UPI0021DFC551|nr:SGNH/GDSL hydrolase family protein [Granulicella arctica]
MSMPYKLLSLIASSCILFAPLARSQQEKQLPASRPEEIEWTWEVRPAHVNPTLPNVLLVGDSITRNYYPEVQRELSQAANVYLFATSTSVGDPRLPHQLAEFASLQHIDFQIVHFNNGMHGWTYSEAEYKQAFPSFLFALRGIAPQAHLIWASITPVKSETQPGPTNIRIEVRNDIAGSLIKAAGIPIDDQHELMTHHTDQYEDSVHFNTTGAIVQGQQVTKTIRLYLMKP